MLSFFQKIKEIFVKPEYHPEAHDEKVAKIIDDILAKGYKKGIKKSLVEIQSVTGLERDGFQDLLLSVYSAMSKPGAFTLQAEASDRIGLGLDDDKKSRLRLPSRNLEALAAILVMDKRKSLEEKETIDSLKRVFQEHRILPPHDVQFSKLIKDICQDGLNDGVRKNELEIEYLSGKNANDFLNHVNPKIESFKATAYDEVVPATLEYLDKQYDVDELRRFRLSDNALEAFATLVSVENLINLTDDEQANALNEIFSHYNILPEHEEQVQDLIKRIAEKGLKKALKEDKKASVKIVDEIKYLTDMSVDEFKEAVATNVKNMKEYDVTGLLAEASLMIDLDVDEDDRYYLRLPEDALEAFGVMSWLSENELISEEEELTALKEIFEYYSVIPEEDEE